jgi:predicted unusual protein kinase regulating ubiquinone biosynthesis (AarF/ABC1/UbiB family)
LEGQLDFNIEKKNMDQLYANFKDNYLVVVPKTILATKDILIMSYEDGESFENNKIKETQKYKIALTLVLILRQGFLIDNFLHADLHNGNWKIRKYDDKDYQIIMYDTGICYSGKNIDINRGFIIAWETNNYIEISKLSMKLLGYDACNLSNEIVNNLGVQLKNDLNKPLSITKVIKTTVYFIKQNNLVANADYLNVVITLAIMEDIFKNYGIMPKDNELVKNTQDLYNIDYIDNINFCNTKGVFLELSKYLQMLVKNNLKQNRYSRFDNLEEPIQDNIECSRDEEVLLLNI